MNFFHRKKKNKNRFCFGCRQCDANKRKLLKNEKPTLVPSDNIFISSISMPFSFFFHVFFFLLGNIFSLKFDFVVFHTFRVSTRLCRKKDAGVWSHEKLFIFCCSMNMTTINAPLVNDNRNETVDKHVVSTDCLFVWFQSMEIQQLKKIKKPKTKIKIEKRKIFKDEKWTAFVWWRLRLTFLPIVLIQLVYCLFWARNEIFNASRHEQREKKR